MTCKGILGSMTDYLEGDIDKNVCAEIEEHLRGCEKCRMHVDTMRAVITLYKRWRSDSMPDDVSMRLKQALADSLPSSWGAAQAKKACRPRFRPDPRKGKKSGSLDVGKGSGSRSTRQKKPGRTP